ncbi:FAD-dependent oxidoreductase [Lyngbya sp. CCY1209]|uniref:NAD(P)/FAD-dependent oxidoreductase n=1 Tax=Lyngbya sp. CCY1209 TaxID=2886103 RepID=UPI002D20EBD7|nr:FAD-dependent oxidoreductase [Lyngbya sp. CCY1209]MEB3883791.1 FAD-dependent oxidoreductase [Lyngbya sp. CCY1209]
MTLADIVVIGAGIAGLTCAKQLRRQGYSVVVVEKSRGVGGRSATRRVGGIRADHGLRYLQPTGEKIRELITEMEGDREWNLQQWTDTIYEWKSGEFKPSPPLPRYVAPRGMNSVGKFLARDLEIWFNRRVTGLIPQNNNTWNLQLEVTGDGNPETPREIGAKAVVVAIPAPQALMVLEQPEAQIPSDLLEGVRSPAYDPCIAVMAGYSPDKWPQVEARTPPWQAVRFPECDRLDWIGLDSSRRPDPSQPVFVLNSSAELARDYLDATDLQPPGKMLLKLAGDRLFSWLDSPEWMQVHRWRYAFCRQPLSVKCLTATTPLPIACAGDWCSQNQIEGVLISGIAAANWIDSQLPNSP